MRLVCPNCNSENIQKVSIIYEAGTNVSFGFGVGYGSKSGSTFLPFEEKTQTKLAQKLAPPEKAHPLLSSIGIIIGINIIVFFIYIFTDKLDNYDKISRYVFYISLIFAFINLINGIRYNRSKWPHIMKKWEKLYFCYKCGHIFELKEEQVLFYSNNSNTEEQKRGHIYDKNGIDDINEKNSQQISEEISNSKKSTKKSNLSLILAIIGTVAWLIPIIGIPVTILGLVFGFQSLKEEDKKKAVISIVLTITFLIFSIINSIIGAYLGSTGQLFNERLNNKYRNKVTNSEDKEKKENIIKKEKINEKVNSQDIEMVNEYKLSLIQKIKNNKIKFNNGIVWKQQYDISKNKNIQVDLNNDGNLENINIGMDTPNGTKINVYFQETGYNLIYDMSLSENLNLFDEASDVKENYFIHLDVFDFDNDFIPEIIVAIGDGLNELQVSILKYTNKIQDSDESPYKEIGSIIGQSNILIDEDEKAILVPYGSQGLYDNYVYKDGKIVKSN